MAVIGSRTDIALVRRERRLFQSSSPATCRSGHDNIADVRARRHKSAMTVIDAHVLARLSLADIDRVTFFKRDELTTDLICCEVAMGAECWTFHEELAGWSLLLSHLQQLPNFHKDWFSEVAQPPFDTCETHAFVRHQLAANSIGMANCAVPDTTTLRTYVGHDT